MNDVTFKCNLKSDVFVVHFIVFLQLVCTKGFQHFHRTVTLQNETL